MKKGTIITFAMGMLGGMALCGSAVQAAAGLTANPTSQTFYVNGQKMEFEAYSICGNNFVKLRDIGKAVDFGVTYDGADNSVHIDPDAPYEEEAPAPTPEPTPESSGEYTISTDHWSREDFSRQANPAVFKGVYDRALYNTIRQTLVDGTNETAPAYTMVSKEDYWDVRGMLVHIDGVVRYEHHVPENFVNYWQYLDYFAVSAEIPENYQAPYDFVKPVIAKAEQMDTDREKVTHLNDYLCTLLAYERTETSGVTQTFSPHSRELQGACSSYARAFGFLCGAANIPCIIISTKDHTWNMVYADSQWLHVDVSLNDLTNSHTMLLRETYPNHPDQAPEQTAFLKELLVPGSTLSK